MFASSRNTNRAGCLTGGVWWYQQARDHETQTENPTRAQAMRLQSHKSPFTQRSPIESFVVGALERETQAMSILGELRWSQCRDHNMHPQQGSPGEAVVSPSLETLRCSDTLTGPSPEQPGLVRPVLSRELHRRLPEVSSNLNYSVPLVMLWLHDGMRHGYESSPTPTGMKAGCKQRVAKPDSVPHGLGAAESRTGSRGTLLNIPRLGIAGVSKMWWDINACRLTITTRLTCWLP